MKEGMVGLVDFAKEDGFELNRYVSQLFEYFSSLSAQEEPKSEPALE